MLTATDHYFKRSTSRNIEHNTLLFKKKKKNTIHPNKRKLACNGKTIRQSVLKKKYLDEK